jgi:prepilin-type N-terminal cleavage/methylation domain-containing protein
MRARRTAFTLIELLVVVAITGTLIAIMLRSCPFCDEASTGKP